MAIRVDLTVYAFRRVYGSHSCHQMCLDILRETPQGELVSTSLPLGEPMGAIHASKCAWIFYEKTLVPLNHPTKDIIEMEMY